MGDVLVTWTSDDGSGTGIYGRKYVTNVPATMAFTSQYVVSADTAFVDQGEFRVNTTTTGNQYDSAVVANRLSGDFVVTWTGLDISGSGIFAQRFSGTTGGMNGTEFQVNTTTSGDQFDCAVGINRFTSEFIVTWTGSDSSGKGIFAQRYDANGVKQGSQFQVNTSTTGDQTDSSIAVDGAGEFYILWTNAGVTANGLQINGQQFDKWGVKKEAELVVNATTTGDQSRASVSIDVYGRVTAVWSGNGTGDANGVFQQRYRTDLHPLEVSESGDADASDSAIPTTNAAASANSAQGQVVPSFDANDELFAILARNEALPRDEFRVDDATEEWPAIRLAPRGRHEAEDSLAIDQLFGSAEWLTGGHYRRANVNV